MTSPPGVSPADIDLPVLGQDGLSTLTTPAVLPAVPFLAPPLNPAAIGLYPLVNWTDTPSGEPSRFLGEGVYLRPFNYGGADAFGVWGASWCGAITRVTVTATGGTWTYTFDGATTADLANNISAADLQTAIEALSTVDPGQVSVTSPSAGVYLISQALRADVGVDGTGLTGGIVKAEPVRKEGDRPPDGDPFAPITVWAYDECDLTAPSQAEVQARAAQNLRLLEQVAVEREFAQRLLTDAGTPAAADDLAAALGTLEASLAATNTVGVIHASAKWAAVAAQALLIVRSGVSLKTPLGHTWAFGGGYVDGLGDTLVATSAPIFGWRSEPQLTTTIQLDLNQFIAMAERSVVVSCEEIIGAATVGS